MSKEETNNSQEQINAAIAAYIKSATEIDERRAKETRELDERRAKETRALDEWRAKEAKELDERRAKEAKELDERRAAEADKRTQDLEKHMKETNKRYGSTARNTGSVTEEKFYQALKTRGHIGNITFDAIERNRHYVGISSGYSVELDIVMHNGIYSLIIEVKYLCHRNDVQKFDQKMHKMHTYLSKMFNSRKLLFGMAANKFNKDAVDYAHEHGMILFHPDGQKVHADTTACTLLHPNTSA